METSFDPTNHPTPIPNILNKAIFDSCLLQDQKRPCLFWLRNAASTTIALPVPFPGTGEKQ